MKDYIKFISFIVAFTIFVLWLNNLIPCPITILKYTFYCPIFSTGLIILLASAIYFAWDLLFWRIKIFPFPLLGKLFGFYNYPDISGEWLITYESSYNYDFKRNKYMTKGKGRATIKQDYEGIYIFGDFGESSNFESYISKLQQKDNGKWFLIYAYRNKAVKPKLKSIPGGIHEGFCYLDINSNCLEMMGYYSNDENRKTRGTIKLEKQNGKS